MMGWTRGAGRLKGHESWDYAFFGVWDFGIIFLGVWVITDIHPVGTAHLCSGGFYSARRGVLFKAQEPALSSVLTWHKYSKAFLARVVRSWMCLCTFLFSIG